MEIFLKNLLSHLSSHLHQALALQHSTNDEIYFIFETWTILYMQKTFTAKSYESGG
jgi:hypothetical protein